MKISKNLISRGLTGIIFVSVILLCTLYSKYSFAILMCFINILALWEFYSIIEKNTLTKINKPVNILGGFIIFGASFLYCSGLVASLVAYLPYICFLIFLFISELYSKQKEPILSIAYSILGQVYISFSFSLLNYIVFWGSSEYHYQFALAIFVIIWVNDSFAYLSGVMFGKHRMFERISPKKSWEGFAGGACFAVITSVIFSCYFSDLSIVQWIGFAIIVVVFGTFGDLVESLMKRTLNIKDSGNILPGHGGMLDRFDSLILAIPAISVYLGLIWYFNGI